MFVVRVKSFGVLRTRSFLHSERFSFFQNGDTFGEESGGGEETWRGNFYDDRTCARA